MGEYISVDGIGQIKLGTCESLYYVRYTDLARWVREGRTHQVDGNDEPAEYLKGAYRFRFPFPDEDSENVDERLDNYGREYNRHLTVQVFPEHMYAEAEHMRIVQWLRPKGYNDWQGGVQYALPCPQGPEVNPDLGERRYLSIVQQRPVEGRLWCVVACAFCGCLWRLEEASAARLAEHITRTRPDQAELARRIVAGYAEGVLDG